MQVGVISFLTRQLLPRAHGADLHVSNSRFVMPAIRMFLVLSTREALRSFFIFTDERAIADLFRRKMMQASLGVNERGAYVGHVSVGCNPSTVFQPHLRRFWT